MSLTENPIVSVIVFSVFFWIIDSVLQTVFFRNGNLLQQIFSPGLYEIWMRLVLIFFIIIFSVVIKRNISALNQAEEALCENERMYSNLFHNSNDAILIHDLDGMIIDANEKASSQFGYSRAEILSLTITDLNSQDKHKIDNWDYEAIIKDEVKNFEVNFRRKNSEPFPADVSSCLFEIQGQKIVQSIVRDLSGRRKAQHRIKNLNDLYKNILDSINHGVVVTDKSDVIYFANEAMKKIAGLSHDNILGSFILEDFPDSNCKIFQQKYWKAKGALTPVHYKTYQTTAGAGHKNYQLRWLVPIIKDGNYNGMIYTVEDITRQKKTEEALKCSEQKFSSIVLNANAGIILSNKRGIIVEFNPAAENIFEIKREQALKMKLWDMTAKFAVDLPFTNKELKKEYTQQTKKAIEFRLEFKIKVNNKTKYIASRISTIKMRSDNLFLQIIDDITEHELMEEQKQRYAAELERSNQELQQFAYVASHDLQEPLRMVRSYVQLLAMRYRGKLDADADDFINYAIDGASRMNTLINDLLAYSRVGTHGKDFKPTDCESVFNRTIANLQVAIKEKDAVVTHDAHLPTVMADETQLVQLFQNLISNAIKFCSEEQPWIHITVEQKGKEWLFAVRDNGIGVEPQYAERIFEIFQRLHSKAEYAGTGIGLAICKKIVERHRGSIRMESELGMGSTFYFTLPIIREKL